MPPHAPRKRFTPAANFTGMKYRDHCTAHGCIRRPHHFAAPYCTRHAHRAFENGSPLVTVVTMAELRQFAPWIADGLAMYRDTPAVRIALKRAEVLMQFDVRTGTEWEKFLSQRMFAMKIKPGRIVTARDVLIEIVALFAFEHSYPERLPTTVCRDIALARSVVRLAHGMRKSPRKSDLVGTGRYLAELFGKFCVLFLDELTKRTRKDNLRRQREDAALMDFSTDADFASPNDHLGEPNDH